MNNFTAVSLMQREEILEVVAMNVRKAHMIREWSSVIALVLWVVDACLTLRHEMRLVWPIALSPIKVVYLILRWSPLFLESAGLGLIYYMGRHTPVSRQLCLNWHIGQTIAVQILLTMVEIIHVLRAYCLYNRKSAVGFLLLNLLTAQFAIMTTFGYRTYHALPFDGSCYFHHTPADVYYFAVAAVAIHAIIWGLAMLRHYVVLQLGWHRLPIVRVVLTDGATSLAIMMTVFLTSVIYAGLTRNLSHVTAGIFITALSSFGSRTILNQLRIPIDRDATPSIAFTTGITSSLFVTASDDGSESLESPSSPSSPVEQSQSQRESITADSPVKSYATRI